MIATPGKMVAIKAVGTFELLGIDMTDNKKVKVIYLVNSHPTYGEYMSSAVTVSDM